MDKFGIYCFRLTLLFILLAFMPLMANAAACFGKSVHVENAGTLSALLTDYEKQNVEMLTVSGNLNGSDIVVLQDMAKASMISLDMSEANIVAGGSAYYTFSSTYSTKQYNTSNNVIGGYMFYHTETLQSVILPNSATTIESAAFGYGSLKSITIGPSVTSITAGLCAGTPLDEIILNNNSSFILEGKILYNKNKTTVYKALASIEGDVTLPSSVTAIENSVFSECNLRSIIIPEKVTEIQTGTFSRCPNLEEVTFNTRLTELGYSSFSSCPKLKSVDLSTTKITEIYSAFYNTASLEEITLPSTLKSITASSITSTALKKVTCYATTPPTLVDGSGNSFAYNYISSSCKVYVPKGRVNAYKAATGWKRFANIYEIGQEDVIPTTPGTKEINGIYYILDNGSNTAEVTYKGTITGVGMSTQYNLDFNYYKDEITIPSSVTDNGITYTVVAVGRSAFYKSNLLKSVKLPDSIKEIGLSAFNECKNLTSVTFGSGLETIRNAAFWECESLTNVSFPSNLSTIENHAFIRCKSLTSITLPDKMTQVEWGTFSDCSNLCEVILGQQTESIGSSAFGNCSKLSAISIPGSVKSISHDSFYGCTSLTDINVEESNSTYCSVDGVLYDKNITHLFLCPQGKQGSYTIPSTVQEIGEHGDITGGFSLCNKLTEVTIPNSVNFIGWMAFSGCTSLQRVISYIQTPFEFDEREFSTWENGAYQFCDATLYVPKGTKTLYQATSAWNKFKMIVEMDEESGVPAVEVSIPNNGNTSFYDLHGRMVPHPATGVYIKRNNGRSQKVYMK